MSSYTQSSKYKLVVIESGGKFQVAIEDTSSSGTPMPSDIDIFMLEFTGSQKDAFSNITLNKNYQFSNSGTSVGEPMTTAPLTSDWDSIKWDFVNPHDGSLYPTSFTGTVPFQMVLAEFTPVNTSMTAEQFKQSIDISHSVIIDEPTAQNESINTLQGDGFGGASVSGGDGPRYVLEHTIDGTHKLFISDSMLDSETEDFNSITLDFTSNQLTKTSFTGNFYDLNTQDFDVEYYTHQDGVLAGVAGDGDIVGYVKFTLKSGVTISQSTGSGNGFLLWTLEADPVGESFNQSGSFYENGQGVIISYGGDTGTTEPTITYTHIGNAGGQSGIDDTETQYPNETTAVQFYEDDNGVFGVAASSLYTDLGADGTETNEMGVYLDLGMGLASTLLPSANTVTAPKAGEIVNADDTVTALDGTFTGVNDIAWTVELSDRTDIFVGRDSVADSASATGYLPGIETVIATGGNDEIDGGGGYNVADFSQLTNTGVQFNMTMGHATFGSNNQQWYGFQEALGTKQSDYVYGTGEEDDELAEDMGSFDFGTNKIEFGAGSNYIEGNGGDDYLFGNGGSDVIHLGGIEDTSSTKALAHGGEGDDLIMLGLGADDVAGGGSKDVQNSSDASDAYNAYYANSSSGSEVDIIDNDDHYNDAGVDYVYFKLADGDRPIDITQLSIQGETETVVIDVPTGLVTETTTWEEFVELANKQINIHFSNIDGTTGQLIADKAYKYMELQGDNANPLGIELYLGEGFSTPSIQDTQVSYFYEDEEVRDAPTWANVTFKGMVVGANGFARKNEFVDGTADDGDVFMAFTAANIDGDKIHDLDIGQNSLSLTGEVGEAIYFASDFTGVQKITLQGYNSDGILIASDSTDPVSYYDAVVTLSDDTPNDTNDDVSFTLTDINGPTASLLTNGGTYKLAAVVNDANMVHTYHDDGLVGEVVNPAVAMKELTFEWQAVGELVASDDANGNAVDNLLTGSNENNLFRGKGGDDVLNGSGGDDTYQFLGTFGNDKVFDFSGNDTISIGADFTDVWLERQGRRGDELEIKVAGRDTSGTISIGRQFNPHSQIASVENIQFGLTADGGAGDTLGLATGNNQGGNIKVLRDGEDAIHAHAERETYIYTNTNEMRGDATVKFLFSDQNSESHTYTPVGGTETTDTWSWMSYNFEIEYADGRVDEFEVKADTTNDFSQFNAMDGSIGQTIAFLSQGGAVQFDTNSNDATIGITNNTETGKTDYSLLGVDGGADLLLFSLEYIDATNYA